MAWPSQPLEEVPLVEVSSPPKQHVPISRRATTNPACKDQDSSLMATQSTSAGGLDSTLGSDTEVSASSDPLRPSERQLRTERRRNIAAQFEGAAGASKHRTGTPHFWSVFAAKPTRAPVPSEADLRMGPHQKDREDPEVPTGRGAATILLTLR